MERNPSNSPPAPDPVHPFKNSRSLLVVLRDEGIDVEEESRLYDQLANDDASSRRNIRVQSRTQSPGPPSIFSNDIWLGDNSGESLAFARDVHISGWTHVGDALGGAYIVYDCVIKTKEGTVIHAHKRYSAFVKLLSALRRTLPRNQQQLIPSLPPKSPLARFRPTFLDSRRRQLEYWLSTVLLHPEVGGSKAVREWVMD
ncbi:hypothetical protein PLICRDRAFT_42715 [Plicaturopsis crispa FD-325 SS-3]|nr:hypothetical protein PLICRDRAFT_42715 [Plicaturopsis crispa FD-325 SS-3]